VRWFDAAAQTFRAKLRDLQQWRNTRPPRRVGPRIHIERVEDFPNRLKAATLYVAGEEPYAWGAAMLCPCGCADVIELNLLAQASPCWSVRKNRDGSITLVPSVWRTKGCRSHFLIRGSRIDWCTTDDLR